MDGLDELMKEVEKSNTKSTTTTKKPSSRAVPQYETATCCNDFENDEMKEDIEFVTDQLKEFMIDIADNHLQQKYYLENASLAQYSIETELNRMDFTIIYQQRRLTKKSEVIDIFYETRLDDLWRFANQSVYADLFVAIQHYYNNSELLISTVASSSQLLINFDERSFEACCLFDFVVESDGSSDHRLRLGSIQGWIKINLKKKILELFVDSPRIPVVFDDEIRTAAKTILKSYYSQQGLEDHSSNRSLRDILSQYAGRVVQSLPSLPRRSSSQPRDSDVPPPSTPTPSSSSSSSAYLSEGGKTDVSNLTESILEGVVGSFGRWIGADKSSTTGPNKSFNEFEDLRVALNQNKELVGGDQRGLSKALDSVSSEEINLKKNNGEDWEEW